MCVSGAAGKPFSTDEKTLADSGSKFHSSSRLGLSLNVAQFQLTTRLLINPDLFICGLYIAVILVEIICVWVEFLVHTVSFPACDLESKSLVNRFPTKIISVMQVQRVKGGVSMGARSRRSVPEPAVRYIRSNNTVSAEESTGRRMSTEGGVDLKADLGALVPSLASLMTTPVDSNQSRATFISFNQDTT